MKKLVLLMVIGMGILESKELDSFIEISNHLEKGKSISLLIESKPCNMSNYSRTCIYTEAHAVMLHPAYLQFANTPLTTNHPHFEKIPVLENVTYRISKNGEVDLTVRVIKLPEYEIKEEHTMSYILGDSVKVYAED